MADPRRRYGHWPLRHRLAALGRIYGLEARSAITGITLLAGFASTVGWPLTAWGAGELGWRETCLAWACAHIVVGLPLNLLLPRASRIGVSANGDGKPHITIDRPMLVLGFAFAASWMVVTAMAVPPAGQLLRYWSIGRNHRAPDSSQ
jgi:predicted MFS family arabinose efflux permease